MVGGYKCQNEERTGLAAAFDAGRDEVDRESAWN